MVYEPLYRGIGRGQNFFTGNYKSEIKLFAEFTFLGSCAWRESGTTTNIQRWARLLKQQTPFTVFHVPTKENNRLFSVSVYRKQMEVCCSFFDSIKQTEVAIFC